MEPNLSQALHLINGETSNAKIQQGGLVTKRLVENKTPEEIISEMYIRCFSRGPTAEETASLVAIVNEQENKKEALEDIFWSMLNSKRVPV